MLSRYDDAEGKFSPDQIEDKIEDFEDQVSGKLTNAPTGRFLIAAGIFGALVIPCGLPAAGAIALPFLVNAVKKALKNGHQAEYVAKTGIFCHLLNHRGIAQLIRFTGRKFIIDQAVQAHIDGMKLTPAAIELVEMIEGELTPTSFDEVKKAFAPEAQKELAPVGNPTRLGAIDVPASPAQSFTIPISSPESKLFDWSQLNSAYDDFPHLLMLGKTGAGKSFLAEKLGRFLNGSTLVITPKKKPKDFVGMQVIGVPYDFATIAANITGLAEIVKQREAEMNRTGEENFLPVNVILDEVPTFVSGCKDIGLDVVKDLKFIIRAGRTSKVRLILLAQGQEVKTLGIEGEGSLRDNLSYVYLKGFAENQAKEWKLDISKYDRPCLIDGKIADIAALVSLAPDPTPQQVAGHKPAPTPQDLERMFNAPSAEHEAEEEAIETSSFIAELQQAFPNWKQKSIEIAALVIDWLRKKSGESFPAHAIRSSISKIKNDPNLPSDRLKKLLDTLVSQGFLIESDGKYSAAAQSEDYDF